LIEPPSENVRSRDLKSPKFDPQIQRRALPQITDVTDDYYKGDLRSRERTFSEGGSIKNPQQKDAYHLRRRNISPNSQNYDYDELVDDYDGLSRHNTVPKGHRYYMPESDVNVRRISPRRQHQNYEK
jgi:hypothetical protein